MTASNCCITQYWPWSSATWVCKSCEGPTGGFVILNNLKTLQLAWRLISATFVSFWTWYLSQETEGVGLARAPGPGANNWSFVSKPRSSLHYPYPIRRRRQGQTWKSERNIRLIAARLILVSSWWRLGELNAARESTMDRDVFACRVCLSSNSSST